MSRRRQVAVILLCLLLVVLVVWLDHSPVRRRWQRPPQSQEQWAAQDFEKYHAKAFIVARVIDGDTIDISIPDGEYSHTRIRLLGIDAPETRSEKDGVMYFGAQAAEFAGEAALGKQVQVYLDKASRTRGKYGRLLAYVRLPDGQFLNEVLVAAGFAYADLRFRHSIYHKYKQLEAVARSQKRGLWQKVTREQLPEWLQRMEPNLLNK